jgi:beta-glucosidase-like glycosyl hydrolase
MISAGKLFPVFFLSIALSLLGCAEKRFDNEALTLVKEMSLDQKVGQMIMAAVPGTGMSPGLESILAKYLPGGVIVYGKNLTTLENNIRFIDDMQKRSMAGAGIPLFVSVDQEGGRVIRFVPGVTQFPGTMAAGVCGDQDLVYRWGRILGLQMRLTGVNMNLAPVLDVNNNPLNPVINTRSFGSDPRLVSDLGAAYIEGLQESRCVAVGKHFPGHGDTDKDSHLTLPVIRYDMKRLSSVELVPFRKAIRAGVDGIMTAHIAYPAILGNNDPATVSKKMLTGLLRDEMGFRGLVITDDMEMHAISRRQDMGEATVSSVLAGADIVLISSHEGNIPVIYNAIKKAVAEKRISEERLNDSVRKIIEVKLRYGIMGLEKGRPAPAPFTLTDKDRKALERANEVNAGLSRGGLLYFGRDDLLRPAKGTVRLFVVMNRFLREELARVPSNHIAAGLGEAPRFAPGKGGKAVLYLQIVKPDLAYLDSAVRFCAASGMDLVVLSSGNPFPITVSGLARAGLLSFSDTEESNRQMGRCLNGEFDPKTGGSLQLGLQKLE